MPRRSAPLLRSGDRRVPTYNRLPPAVKEGLRAIARKEGRSMSWVVEEVIIQFFHLKVQYKRSSK